MAEALKEMFNRAYFERLATTLADAAPGMRSTALLEDLLRGNETRALNARMRHASTVLHAHLPADFHAAVDILKAVAPRMPTGYTALLYPDFVGRYGLDEPAFSLAALEHFTVFGSSEFAVREFLRQDLPGTLRVMRTWAEADNEHVRRLASEGSRPRLPWSFRLEAIARDPALTRPILERLGADPALYVRKSVANHLNDFSKAHPRYVVDLLRLWDLQHPATAWIARHASRSLIKAGDAQALALFAFDREARARVTDIVVTPVELTLGDTLELAFTLVSEEAREQAFVVDYALHYRRTRGATSRKVFKLKEVMLAPGQSLRLVKRQRIVDMSTRRHYPGDHLVEVLVNGRTLATASFDLRV